MASIAWDEENIRTAKTSTYENEENRTSFETRKRRKSSTEWEHEKKIKRHAEIINSVRSMTDTSPPKTIATKEKNFLRTKVESIRSAVQETTDLALVRGICTEYRSKGRLGTLEPEPKNYTREAWVRNQRRALLRLTEENKMMQQRLNDEPPRYSTKKFLDEFKKTEEQMQRMARYPLIWKVKRKSGAKENHRPVLTPTIRRDLHVPRTRCFLDIVAGGYGLERMEILLYDDIVPKTAANFRALCLGESCLCYKFCPFYRILPELLCESGDVTHHNGLGGCSIYGETFEDENFQLKHSGTGFLSMVNRGPDTNNSKFRISFKALPTLDGNNVVFGKVINGLRTLLQIEEYGLKTGKLRKPVFIVNCGVL